MIIIMYKICFMHLVIFKFWCYTSLLLTMVEWYMKSNVRLSFVIVCIRVVRYVIGFRCASCTITSIYLVLICADMK